VIDAGHGGKDFGARGPIHTKKKYYAGCCIKLQVTLTKAVPDGSGAITTVRTDKPKTLKAMDVLWRFISLHPL